MKTKLSFLLGCSLFLSGCNPNNVGESGKIISVNPCTDAILLELADPDQIGAISHYSHDPRSSSTNVAQARTYRAIGQSAEEIIAQKPALVLAGGHISASTLDALKRMDIEVLQSPVANSVAQSYEQITTIAAAIGQEKRGEALIAKIETALNNAAPQVKQRNAEQKADEQKIAALVWQGGGLVAGKNTLIDEIMTRSGYENMAAQYGLAQWDIIGLERLSANPPAIILRGGDDMMLHHPILEEINAKTPYFPPSMIWCAGPTIAKAAAHLAKIRNDYWRTKQP